MGGFKRFLWQRLACGLFGGGDARNRRRSGRQGLITSRLISGEFLERRELLTGLTWDNPEDLTASIAPDGTKIAGQSSTFSQSFSSLGTPAQLQRWLMDSFQAWTKYANVNVGLVRDNGLDFGAPGETQGDKRFGDIRIGAIPMASDVLAVSIPHTGGAAGTLAGDILFNSGFHPTSVAQFKAVAMQEIGHVLGLEHSTEPTSPMYPRNSPRTVPQPTDADIQALRTLHGSRLDRNEIDKPNDDMPSAGRLRDGSYNGFVPLLNYGDLSATTDTDFYILDKVDLYRGPVTVSLKVRGLSLIQARIEILDTAGKVIASASSTSPGRDLTVSIPTLDRYVYVRVSAVSAASPYAIGRYALVTTFDGINTVSASRIQDMLFRNLDFLRPAKLIELFQTGFATSYLDDLHANDTGATATAIRMMPGFAENSRYEFYGTISDLRDKDFYSIKSPSTVTTGTVLSVTVDAADLGKLLPSIVVYDDKLQALTPVVLKNAQGIMTVQIPNVVANRRYFVRIAGASTDVRFRTGNYALKARFSEAAEKQEAMLRGSVSSSVPRVFQEMNIQRTTMLNLALQTIRPAGSPLTAVQVTIYNTRGREIHRIVSFENSTRTSSSLLLLPGKYFVRFNAVSRDSAAFDPITYRLLGSVISDPVGPIGSDPTTTMPVTSGIDNTITYSTVTLTPPPTVVSSPTENPFVYLPPPTPTSPIINYQDWYWYYGTKVGY